MSDQSPLTTYRADNRLTLEGLAELVGVNKSTILRWEEGGIPVERVFEVERITGISRDKLRPDIFAAGAAA